MKRNKRKKKEIDSNKDEEEQRPVRTKTIPKKFDDYVMLTFEEANSSNYWREAIKSEKDSLEENRVWKEVDEKEAKGKKILSSKWVFKVKNDGTYKARLVTRGFEQKEGIDYEETFSPVINDTSIRMLIAIAASKNYHIMKLDIKTAFLYGELKENIYMKIPQGFPNEGKVCKLLKSLYGLKQAPLRWNTKFSETLKENGLIPLKTDPCLFKTQNCQILLGIYVDDGLLMGVGR